MRQLWSATTRSTAPSLRRTISTSPVTHQVRHRLRKTPRPANITRPSLVPNNPYLPSTAILTPSDTTSAYDHPNVQQLPIIVPLAALDSKLSRKLKNSPIQAAVNQISDPIVAQQVRRDGETQFNQIVEDWVRNELNVMGTIREETLQIFIKLLLHPSTLAPLADQLKLQTAGRDQPVKSSGKTPRRLAPASTVADEELIQLLHYMIGATYRSLLPRLDGLSKQKFKRYVINLVKVGLTNEIIKKILVRASQLSGQDQVGNRKGFARAEIRVAQLEIWGQRRCKKINKLVPEQVIHRTKLRCRKAQILKQRWIQEELKMIHWRNRLIKITEFQEHEKEMEKLRRLDHENQVKQWRINRQLVSSSSSSTSSSSSSSISQTLSKFFNFWPFNSSDNKVVQSSSKI